jgi:F-type H+-transporting ATPase subunit b
MVGSETLWVWVALLLFAAVLFYFGVHKTILGGLDKRAETIANDLNEAKRLREEAQKLLASYDEKRKAAEVEAAAIVAAAQEEAKRIEAEGKTRIDDFVKRRTAQAELKIAQAEQSATGEVRAAAAEAAVKAAEILMSGKGAGLDDLFTKGLAEVRTKLN